MIDINSEIEKILRHTKNNIEEINQLQDLVRRVGEERDMAMELCVKLTHKWEKTLGARDWVMKQLGGKDEKSK